MSEEEKFEGRIHGPQFDPDEKDSIWVRMVYMTLIAQICPVLPSFHRLTRSALETF